MCLLGAAENLEARLSAELHRRSKRRKKLSSCIFDKRNSIFILFWILPVIFPYLRYTFWLFTGDYFRAYSFFISVIFILFSVYALDQIVDTLDTRFEGGELFEQIKAFASAL